MITRGVISLAGMLFSIDSLGHDESLGGELPTTLQHSE